MDSSPFTKLIDNISGVKASSCHCIGKQLLFKSIFVPVNPIVWLDQSIWPGWLLYCIRFCASFLRPGQIHSGKNMGESHLFNINQDNAD